MHEDILGSYVDEESDELLIKMRDAVESDGFPSSLPDDPAAVEEVVLRILSATTVKVMATMCERDSHENLAVAYLNMVPDHAELVRRYLVKEIERRLTQ